MDWDKQLKALDESYKHWDRLATGTAASDEGIGSAFCALCEVSKRCGDCIIFGVVGEKQCRGTPYYGANAVQWLGKDSHEFQQAAGIERNFLNAIRQGAFKATVIKFNGEEFFAPPWSAYLTIDANGTMKVHVLKPFSPSLFAWESPDHKIIGGTTPPENFKEELYILEEE
jgi:hypothetical protein